MEESVHVAEVVLKCFRCNLVFKDEKLAMIHKEIMNHSVTKIHVQAAS